MEVTSTNANNPCPACGSTELSSFHRMERIPVLSCTIWNSEREARECPKGDIELALCRTCGLLINTVFEPALLHYDEAYVASLHHSPLFGRYAHDLATDLIDRYDLHEKLVLEIGCGKGEFLQMMVDLGNNRGVGFDPSYEEGDASAPTDDRLTFVKDFYTEAHLDLAPDLVIARQLLEHVEAPLDFVSGLRRTLGARKDAVVVFEVPNALDMLQRADLWDVIYEHPIYFTPQALERLMRSAGFDVHRVTPAYEGLFLIIEASPGDEIPEGLDPVGHLLEDDVTGFAKAYRERLSRWDTQLREIREKGQRAVLWGAGARGDTFLNAVGVRDEIPIVVDLNPRKWGQHMAGTGQSIHSPEELKANPPDVVVVSNEIYLDEIGASLRAMGIDAKLLVA